MILDVDVAAELEEEESLPSCFGLLTPRLFFLVLALLLPDEEDEVAEPEEDEEEMDDETSSIVWTVSVDCAFLHKTSVEG